MLNLNFTLVSTFLIGYNSARVRPSLNESAFIRFFFFGSRVYWTLHLRLTSTTHLAQKYQLDLVLIACASTSVWRNFLEEWFALIMKICWRNWFCAVASTVTANYGEQRHPSENGSEYCKPVKALNESLKGVDFFSSKLMKIMQVLRVHKSLVHCASPKITSSS